jgi:hypothetical protein
MTAPLWFLVGYVFGAIVMGLINWLRYAGESNADHH